MIKDFISRLINIGCVQVPCSKAFTIKNLFKTEGIKLGA